MPRRHGAASEWAGRAGATRKHLRLADTRQGAWPTGHCLRRGRLGRLAGVTHRILPAVVLVAATLTACGGDPARPPAAGPAASTPAGAPVVSPGAPTATAPPSPAEPPATATVPTTATAPIAPVAPSAPAADGSTERRPPSPPPVVLPPRQAGAPSAREVVAAFRAAGLKATNSRDRSVDCGPDGLGLGCSELVVTDGVTVYVFPDESSAGDIAELWSGGAYRRGTVVLNYLEAPTPHTDRPRYEKTLTTLR